MTLKPLRCPNCSAKIENIDDTQKKAFCPFCDSVIVDVPDFQVKFAIELSGSVRVNGIPDLEKLFSNAQTMEKLGEKNKAIEIYTKIAEEYPEDCRGHLGLARLDGSTIKKAREHFRKARLVAKPNDFAMIDKEYKESVLFRLDEMRTGSFLRERNIKCVCYFRGRHKAQNEVLLFYFQDNGSIYATGMHNTKTIRPGKITESGEIRDLRVRSGYTANDLKGFVLKTISPDFSSIAFEAQFLFWDSQDEFFTDFSPCKVPQLTLIFMPPQDEPVPIPTAV